MSDGQDVIERAKGLTPSEAYLAKLADQSFLDLWSYPNVYIDKIVNRGTSVGKELCDLLVVCGDHVLLFSDKTIRWPDNQPVDIAWARWYKKAVKKSVDQINGAVRWIRENPDRVFLDHACTRAIPFPLPTAERMKLHCIIVALGAGKACSDFFGEGSGSLVLLDDQSGETGGDRTPMPFTIGDVNPSGPYVHVLDDTTLDIVLQELDTITDFTEYLERKSAFIRAGNLLGAHGEEELLAVYLMNVGPDGRHGFFRPDGSPWTIGDRLMVDGGHYRSMRKNPQYVAKKKADRISYLWDNLIKAFTKNIIGDSLARLEGWSDRLDKNLSEIGVRYMALEDRTARRYHSLAVRGAFESIGDKHRFFRVMMPGPSADNQDTAFCILLFRVPDEFPEVSYERYRQARTSTLYGYALNVLRKNPKLKRIIGLAMEPWKPGQSGSEDMIYAEQPVWTEEMLEEASRFREHFDLLADYRIRRFEFRGNEYPDTKGVTSDYRNPIPYKYKETTGKREARRLEREMRSAERRHKANQRKI